MTSIKKIKINEYCCPLKNNFNLQESCPGRSLSFLQNPRILEMMSLKNLMTSFFRFQKIVFILWILKIFDILSMEQHRCPRVLQRGGIHLIFAPKCVF